MTTEKIILNGEYDKTTIEVIKWKGIKQIEIFIERQHDKRVTRESIVLKDDNLDKFKKFLEVA